MKRIIIFLFLLFSYTLFARKAVIVSLPGITPEELYNSQYKNILFVAERGAVGLANCRLYKKYPSESAYLAMGTARMIKGGEEARLCFGADEFYKGTKADIQFERLWGVSPPPDALLHIGFPSLVEANQSLKGKTDYHLLGDLLVEKGIKTILLGNGDILGEPHREASLALVDSRGIVKGGDVSDKLLVLDPCFPGGVRTNFSALKDALRKYLQLDNIVLIIETGDSLRIDLQYPYLNENRRETLIGEFLSRVDDMVGFILHYLSDEDLFIITAPYPGRWALKEGRNLSPVIAMGNGLKGLLTSGTTKTLGVVSHYDFSPTIASFFGGPKRLFLGKTFYSKSIDEPIKTILRIRERSWRSWTIHKIISAHIVALTLTFLLLGFILPLLNPFYRLLILIPLLFPFALLLLAPLSLTELPLIFSLSILTILLFFICSFYPSKSLLYITIATIVFLSFDLLHGSQLMASSGIGHSVEEGARYYGIGNEFMGLLVGYLLVLLYHYGNNFLQRFLWLIYAILVGAPWWGANWGGLITLLAGFIYLSINHLRHRGRVKLYLVAIFIMMVCLPVIFDTLTRGTHIGLAFRNLLLGKADILFEIVQRKIMTNVRLLRYSDWTVTLIGECILLFLYYILRFYLAKKDSSLWLKTVLICTIVAFIFNDSGVVASVFLLMPVIAVILIEEVPVELARKWMAGREGKSERKIALTDK
ncbi:hypothetical protein H5T87_02275 [bacterium]|nr:hypothetical protein [bacterium]